MVLSMLLTLSADRTRKLPLTASLGLLLLLPAHSASADSWYGFGRHYDGWRYGADRYDYPTGRAWRDPYRYRDNSFSISWGRSWSHNRYRDRYLDRYYDRRHWRSYNRQHWHSHDGDVAASLVGGLVLGSLLSHAVQPRSTVVYSAEPQRRVIRSSRVSSRRSIDRSPSAATGSRLLRDLEGRCFEIGYDAAGNQQRIQVEDSRCHF